MKNYKPKDAKNAIAYYYTFVNPMGSERQCYNYISKKYNHLSIKKQGFNKIWQKELNEL